MNCLRARIAVALVSVLLISLPALSSAKAGFYDTPPGRLAGPAGSIIQIEGMDAGLSTAQAYRILYRSVLPDGKPIAVSGIAVVPSRKVPANGWPVVAWAHGTTGVVRKCAPSLLPNPVSTIPGINRMLQLGYVVVATDFVGLGAEGVHPYLVGESAGRAVLDSVRAAAHFGGGKRYAVWGYSQGGHAAMFTGQIAPKYAPDLQLVGVAAAAPASKLGLLLENDLNSLAGKVLTAMALRSWSQVYGAPLGTIVKADSIKAMTALSSGCVNVISDELKIISDERRMPHAFLSSEPTQTRPWSITIAANTPTLPPRAPVFIAQGTNDHIVSANVTDLYVAQLCRQGAKVDYVKFKGVTHHQIAKVASTRAVGWIVDRFARKPAPDTCG